MKHYETPDILLRELTDIIMTSDMDADLDDQYNEDEKDEE